MLLEDLLAYYNKLERPVANESEAVVLTFGLTLQQIIDVVCLAGLPRKCLTNTNISSGREESDPHHKRLA